jgi:hypothetical protein
MLFFYGLLLSNCKVTPNKHKHELLLKTQNNISKKLKNALFKLLCLMLHYANSIGKKKKKNIENTNKFKGKFGRVGRVVLNIIYTNI